MSENLLLNPSFEDDTATPPGSWFVGTNAGGLGSATAMAIPNAFDESNSALLTLGGGGAGSFVILQQIITLPTDTTHLHLSYVLWPFPPTVNGVHRARITWLTAAGAVISTEDLQLVKGCATLNAWDTHTAVTGTAPAGAARARLELTLGFAPGCTGDIFLDNVILTTD